MKLLTKSKKTDFAAINSILLSKSQKMGSGFYREGVVFIGTFLVYWGIDCDLETIILINSGLIDKS